VISAWLSGRAETYEVAVVDETGASVVRAAEEVLQAQDDETRVEVTEESDAAAAEQAVADEEVNVALVPDAAGQDGGYTVVARTGIDNELQSALSQALSTTVLQANADAAGVSVQDLFAGTDLSERLLEAEPEDTDVISAASFFAAILFYVTALTFGITISQSVVQEKESRVVEILAAAVPIRAMLWGKIAGNTVLALAQIVLLVLVGLGGLVATGRSGAMDGIGLAAAWYVLFFVLGFVALASFWSVAGSLATRQEDLQTTTLPGQIILLVPYLLAVTGSDRVQEVVSVLPIVSAMTMPGRIADGSAPWWQVGLALALTVLTAAGLVRLGSRLYARTLLQTSRRTTYREALRSGS
jgi:ABC-2 type transport system permease protein